jgi:hypothetical protein
LQIKRKLFKNNNNSIAKTLNNIGSVEESLGNYQEAE